MNVKLTVMVICNVGLPASRSILFERYRPTYHGIDSSRNSGQRTAGDEPYLMLPRLHIDKYSQLQRHQNFAKIKNQFLQDIDKLIKLAPGYVGEKYKTALNTFRGNIADPALIIQDSQIPLYRETRYQLHQIVARMEANSHVSDGFEPDVPEADMERDKIIQVLHTCLDEIDRCSAGIHDRFTMAYSLLQVDSKSLQGKLFQIRKDRLDSFISAFLKQIEREGFVSIPNGMEIHWASTLYNSVCRQYGLDSIEDPTAPPLRHAVTERFLADLPLAINEFIIVNDLVSENYQQLCDYLQKSNLSHWLKGTVSPGELTTERTEPLEQTVLQPINTMCKVNNSDKKICFQNLVVDEGSGYSLARCREFIHGWITRTVIGDSATVLASIPVGPDQPSRCIGTYQNLFFWIFETKYPLGAGEDCLPYDTEAQTQPLTISELSAIDIFTWPEHVQMALLTQAIAQTGIAREDANKIADFLLGSGTGQPLQEYPPNIQKAVLNLLSEKMATSPAFAESLVKTLSQSFTDTLPDWVINSPLLEPLLLSMQDEGKNIQTVTDKLSLWDIMPLSSETLKKILTRQRCQEFFRLALDEELGGLMWRLLQTDHCDDLKNHSSQQTNTVLMVFSAQGVTDGVIYLLERLSIEDINSKNIKGETVLHKAAGHGQAACLEKLLAKDGIALKEKGIHGWIALHNAAFYNYPACLKMLIDKDSSTLQEKTHQGWTGLHIVSRYGYEECLELILASNNIPLNVKNESGWTALHLVVGNGHTECLEKLLEKPDLALNMKTSHTGGTAVHVAVAYNRSDCLKKLLLQPGIALNKKSGIGLTALHYSVDKGHTVCLEKLLAHPGIDPNRRTRNGSTALHLAAKLGHEECLKKLLQEERVRHNAKDFWRRTALIQAVSNGNNACVWQLLNNPNTALNSISLRGHTARNLARTRNNVNAIFWLENDLRFNRRLNDFLWAHCCY
ncbi:ankyrin repeat domain-containing protein [Sansalvadorimonas sp. 2012CJ34-2]|uniref:Ankyrin repeat domain-containing protein n=1 Tax=Parendozoicomonas callyspongiae TaxID=2942213 RepID=A0ABT0PHM0_9GAMM|nr:ankyrin repeat domain-containing protein [Sansalvadorimonas sp. 2012CJ34-2]MCL6270864.1 ankyrin repeat domain-containing protein [Sansalvadorimonas sp. 2012CJ34-2]